MLTLVPNEHWNYGPIDMIQGLRTALSPVQPETPIQIPGVGPAFPVRSARVAMVLALKALALPPGASVGVPLYCCPVVFKAIKAADCRPRFIDVDPRTCCLSPADLAAKSSEIDAVIAVHMFGNVCDMHALRKATPGKPLIEDCAQALGSRFDGRFAGSFGKIAVFSFRSGKYLSVGEGGAMYCNETSLKSQLSKLISTLPVPGRLDECIHVATTCLRSMLRTKPLWGLIGVRLWEAYSAKVSYASQSPLVLEQIFRTDRDMTIRRLPFLTTWIERQRSNAAYYDRNLTVDPGMLCTETPHLYFNRLQYPLLAPTPEQCDEMTKFLRRNEISTARPYKDIATIASEHYGYTGDCPQAERIARTVFVIPCNHALKATDVERIASCVNRAWAHVGGSRRSPQMSFNPTETQTVDTPATERTA